MRKKGFTLIELLVVIAIIAMLLAILMPALGKVKKLAERLVCATNLRGLTTAGVIYSNDADGNFPRQGGIVQHELAYTTQDWFLPGKDWKVSGTITIAASLYLLVKYADVGPKSFVCKGGDETVFNGDNPPLNLALEELWDFGASPKLHVSYAYHRPYPNPGGASSYPISTSDKTERAIIGDKSPWFDPKLDGSGLVATSENWEDVIQLIENDWTTTGVDKYLIKVANSAAHEREGQNIGFGDCHVLFERRPDIGVRNDNVYTPFKGNTNFTEIARRIGTIPAITSRGKTDKDTFLMNDDIVGPQ